MYDYRCKSINSYRWERFNAENARDALEKACKILNDKKENIFLQCWDNDIEHYTSVVDPAILTFHALIKISLTSENVEDIAIAAFCGGINYWVKRIKMIDAPMKTTAAEFLSDGGTLQLFDAESDEVYELTLEKFVNGFKKWVEDGKDEYGAVSTDEIDCSNIDAECADEIIQYALFGEVVFG